MLNTSVTVIRRSVADGRRTVVLARPSKGLSPRHHDFDAQQLSLDFISAVGSTPSFGYHKAKTVGTLPLWPQPAATPDSDQMSGRKAVAAAAKHAPAAACVCSVPAAPFGSGSGTIEYLGGPAKPAG